MTDARSDGRPLTIVAPRGYPWTFNGPRRSRHQVRRTAYLPLNRLRPALDGVTAFSPLDTARADLIHAFNRIPVGVLPFVVGYESHLPRTWGLGAGWERLLLKLLLARRCRRIVAISNYAAENFRAGLAAGPLSGEARDQLVAKLEVRYPNIDVPKVPPPRPPMQGRLVATFVGAHFGRKGGCTVLRMADLAYRRDLPIEFNIVSSMQVGGSIWTDPTREDFFTPYRSLLSLPNITYRAKLPNAEVLALLQRSHICLLPTFADTFGFSVLEAMAMGTPALATAQAAIPEVIDDGIDGLLLAPARTPGHDSWVWPFAERGREDFEALFAEETERLAEAGLDKLVRLLSDPSACERMSAAAHKKVLRMFNSEDAQTYWDSLYADCVEGRERTVAFGSHFPPRSATGP